MKNKYKQVDILKTLKPKELETSEDKPNDKEEVFNQLCNERIGELYNISKKNNFNNLTHHSKSSNTAKINFIDFRAPMHVYNEIKNGNMSIEKIEQDKKQFK